MTMERIFKRVFGGYQPAARRWHGILGNSAGAVEVPGRAGYYYARIEKGSEYEEGIFQATSPLRPLLNYPVQIEADPVTGMRVITGADMSVLELTGQVSSVPPLGLARHAASHGWNDGADDQLQDLHTLQFYQLRAQPTATAAQIVVLGGTYYIAGVPYQKYAPETIDLTSYLPAAGIKWVRLYIDAEGTISVLDNGAETLSDLDPGPPDTFSIAAIRLRPSGEIRWAGDIEDLRFAAQSTGAQAESVVLDTTNFDGGLSPADTNVQLAMDTLDDLTAAASESSPGIIELATQAEVSAGTDGERAVTPATLAGRINELGAMLFNEDGLLLLGPYCAAPPGQWITQRGQVATITGAFPEVPGRFPGTRARRIEVGANNLCPNPSFGVDTTSWAAYGSGSSMARITTDSFRGIACIEITTTNAGNYGCRLASQSITASTKYVASGRVKGPVGQTIRIQLQSRDGSDAFIGSSNADFVCTGEWQHVYVSRSMEGSAVYARVLFFSYDFTGTFRADCVQLELAQGDGDDPTSYLDGDMGEGYSWSGTPHASSSTRVVTEVNLDNLAFLISGKTTLTYSVWIQPQYDADEQWPRKDNYNFVIDAYDSSTSGRIFLAYDDADDKWSVYLNGAERFQSSVQSFIAGDWLHLALAVDYTNDAYSLFINGVLDGSGTPLLSAPTLTEFNLGSNINGLYQASAAYDEFYVFSRVLTVHEIAALYALQRPLVDSLAYVPPYAIEERVEICSGPNISTSSVVTAELLAPTTRFWFAAGSSMYVLDIGAYHAGSTTGNIYLYYNDAGTWRPVPGASLSLSFSVTNPRFDTSSQFWLSPGWREYALYADSDGFTSLHVRKATLRSVS